MWAYEKLWRLPAFSGSGFSPLRLRSIPLRGTAPQGLQSLADCRTCLQMDFSQIKKSCAFTGFYSRLSDLNQVFWSQPPVASRQTPPAFAAGGLLAAFSPVGALVSEVGSLLPTTIFEQKKLCQLQRKLLETIGLEPTTF